MSVGVNHASNQSIRPFKSSEEYIYAMKEDLAEWLGDLYHMDIDACNILEALETGTVLCEHANIVTQVAREFIQKFGMVQQIRLPTSGVTFVDFAQPATFLARDNISNFINWCRTQMNIKDVLMFETNDLVQRKNEKNVVLCLLEVARRASRFGMAAPVLIQLEEEIEEEMREDLELPHVEVTPQAKPQRRTSNTQNLDQMVQHLISRCTCPLQFPMVKVSEGKYKVGDSNTIIFIRILRNHVMVRVGGGWDTLEHYLDKHDPCRCTSVTHKLTQRPSTPVHEIKGRLSPRPGRTQQPATLLLNRHAQAPLQSVVWTPSATSSTARTSARAWGCPSLDQGGGIPEPVRHCAKRWPSGEPDHGDPLRTPHSGSRTSSSLNRELRAPPSKLRQSMSTPTLLNQQDDSKVNSSARTGREVTRSTPTCRLTSSLPRPVPRSSTPQPQKTLTQPQPQRAKTPLVFQKTPAQLQSQPQSMGDSRLTQTWTKSQFVSKLRQSSMLGVCNTASASSLALQRQAGCGTPRPASPVRGHSPVRYTPDGFKQPCTVAKIQQPKEISCHQNRSGFIRTFCPSSKRDENPDRHFTPLGGHLTDTQNKQPTMNNQTPALANSYQNPKGNMQTRARPDNVFETRKVSHELELTAPSKVSENDGEINRNCLFVPPPISPAQEASLYQSLEHEILANLQQLSVDSDNSSAPKDNPTKRNSRHRASWNERSHGGLEMDSGRSKPPWSEAGYDAVIAELSQGKRLLQNVCLENWVSSSVKDQSNKKVPKRKHAACSGQSVDTKPSLTSSWSSAGSSIESMKQQSNVSTSPDCKNEASNISHITTMDTSNNVNSRNNSVHPHGLHKSKTGSIRPRRSLRKPDRVPSIYKLRFQPRARPRYDHRPGKKPSRIPTPVSYRESQPSKEEPCERRGDAQREVHVGKSRGQGHRISQTSVDRYQQQWSCKQRADTRGQSVSQYSVEDQEEESWV